jgi:hypothetical protein
MRQPPSPAPTQPRASYMSPVTMVFHPRSRMGNDSNIGYWWKERRYRAPAITTARHQHGGDMSHPERHPGLILGLVLTALSLKCGGWGSGPRSMSVRRSITAWRPRIGWIGRNPGENRARVDLTARGVNRLVGLARRNLHHVHGASDHVNRPLLTLWPLGHGTAPDP